MSPSIRRKIRSSLDLPRDLAFDVLFRYVDAVGTRGVDGFGTPKFTNVDVRLGWLMRPGMELSIVGQNLVYDHREEFSGGTEVQRAVYSKAALKF